MRHILIPCTLFAIAVWLGLSSAHAQAQPMPSVTPYGTADSSSGWRVRPNLQDNIHLKLIIKGPTGEYTAQLTAANGQEIKVSSPLTLSQGHETELNLGVLQAGTYHLTINGPNGQYQDKVTVIGH